MVKLNWSSCTIDLSVTIFLEDFYKADIEELSDNTKITDFFNLVNNFEHLSNKIIYFKSDTDLFYEMVQLVTDHTRKIELILDKIEERSHSSGNKLTGKRDYKEDLVISLESMEISLEDAISALENLK
ncbi:hypothetical protein [Methanolacinia petrolearia]|uniref:hypothetical protein n=1 Tax=Methanolacinia petrolearia TaxID=54120 RepID=UPI003BABCB42